MSRERIELWMFAGVSAGTSVARSGRRGSIRRHKLTRSSYKVGATLWEGMLQMRVSHAIRQYLRFSSLAILLVLVIACSPPAGSMAIVSCVDGTASYRYTQQALEFTARVATEVLLPRDVLMVRWIIDEDTAGTDAIILSTVIPPVTTNQFAPQRAAQVGAAGSARAQAVSALRAARPPVEAKGSNILGCVAKADQLFDQTRPAHSVLFMGSDVGENIELPYRFDLTGVDVICFPCQSERNTNDIDWFRSVVLSAGAKTFQVFDPQVSPTVVLAQLKEVRHA